MSSGKKAPKAHIKSSEAADKNVKWTAEGVAAEGGNVVAWLAQKTGAPQQAKQQPESRGAIEYFNQQASKGQLPKPRSQQQQQPIQHVDPSIVSAAPVVAPTGAPAKKAVGSLNDLAKLFPKQSVAASATVQKASEEAPPSKPHASVPAAPANPSSAAPKAATPAVARTREQRHEESRNRRGAPRPSANERQQAQEAETLKKAEEEHATKMQTDQDYQRRFNEMQQIQVTQQQTQMQFFEHYRKQEHMHINELQVERLDIPVIMDLIDKHDVVFICTDTGSGKSTSIPKALLEANPANRIVSTQPRRTATVAIANRVASLRREQVGDDVGYWIRGEKRGDDQTRLWYMTSYTMLLHLLNHPLNPPFTHIILDEFHERQPDLEVTVALLKLCLKNKTANFKLILMSATLNTDDWESYFDGLRVAAYKQSEPEHPIHDYFMEDVCSLLGMPHTPPLGLTQHMVDQQLLEKHLFIAQNLIMALNSCSLPQHSILVFLPGRAQVESFNMWLEMNLSHRMDIIPWHSAVDLSVIQAALHRRPYNKQKIYLATDIAEVSITLPDVVFVIDLVLVKRPQIQLSQPATILYPPLVVQWISKGSVAQRRGRAGRVQQGFYFCLLSSHLIPSLADHAAPPIEHARIDELALHSLQVVSNPVAMFSICRGQPLVQSIISAMATLQHLGCIIPKTDPLAAAERILEVHSNGEWDPLVLREARSLVAEGASIQEFEYTFIGRLLQLIPVSPQQGMLVFYGFMTGLESLMILAAAVTSSLSPFSVNPDGHAPTGRQKKKFENVARMMEQTEQVMKDHAKGLRSDIVAIMSAAIQFRMKANEFGFESPVLRQWCRQQQLSIEKLIAIVELEAHIKYELANFIPFRDVAEPEVLASQLEKVAPMVLFMTNVAFAAQALEVTSEGNSYASTKEGAVGLFTDLRAVPDLHSPSCLRWEHGDIIVPVTISLHYSRMLVSFSTAIKVHKQFWLSLLLFAHHMKYAIFSDDEGVYAVFGVTYCGRTKFLETDGRTAQSIIDFRKLLSNACSTIRLRYSHKDMFEEDFEKEVLGPKGLLGLSAQQRNIMTVFATEFFGTTLEQIEVIDVEHEEDDLDQQSMLSFQIA